MARSRNIKPGFFTNDLLAEVPPLGRLLFAGLWTIADRAGRLEDRPRKIKAELLPYDDCHIGQLLDELGKRGFLERYQVDGVPYIQITNFEKHQNPHIKEAESTIPPPVGHTDGLTDGVSDEYGASTVLAPDEHRSSPADSLNPLTDSLNPLTDSLNRIPDSLSRSAKPPKEPKYTEEFESFWSMYPRKTAKYTAFVAWQKIRPGPEVCGAIAQALSWQRDQWGDPKFVPHPATWLNQRRWEDERPVVAAGAIGRSSPKLSNYEISMANIRAALGEPDQVIETTGVVR